MVPQVLPVRLLQLSSRLLHSGNTNGSKSSSCLALTVVPQAFPDGKSNLSPRHFLSGTQIGPPDTSCSALKSFPLAISFRHSNPSTSEVSASSQGKWQLGSAGAVQLPQCSPMLFLSGSNNILPGSSCPSHPMFPQALTVLHSNQSPSAMPSCPCGGWQLAAAGAFQLLQGSPRFFWSGSSNVPPGTYRPSLKSVPLCNLGQFPRKMAKAGLVAASRESSGSSSDGEAGALTDRLLQCSPMLP